MPKSIVVGFIVFGLIVSGCATQQSATQVQMAPKEPICWDPPPERTAHPVLDWCKAHPWTVGIGTGLLVIGGIVAGSAIALNKTGAGAALVWGGMH
jgi:hypothetical protein